MSIDLRFTPKDDKTAIFLILDGLVRKGYAVVEVADDTWDTDQRVKVADAEAATLAVCEVDEAYVFLKTPDGRNGYIYFVLGNEPYEVACDYTTNLDPDLGNITDPWMD